MNACNNLPLYLYGELNAQDKKVFEEHLASCKECQENMRIFKEIKENKKVYRAPKRVIDAIFEKTTKKRTSFIFSKSFKLGLALAACFLAVILAAPLKKDAAFNNYSYADNSMEEIINIDSELDEFESDFMFYA
jgi:anti-sigma factor RsiW